MSDDKLQYLRRPTGNFVDGIAYNAAVIPNPYVYQSLGYKAMEGFRMASNYRPKIYAVPDQSQYGTPAQPGLTPFTDYVTQVRMVPGTVVLGLTLANINYAGPDANDFTAASNVYLNATEDGTGIPFFDGWLTEVLFNVPVLYNDPTGVYVGRSVYVAKSAWLPLTKPRTILAPGSVTVTVCYKGTAASANIAPQLIFQCGEPCGSSIQGDC